MTTLPVSVADGYTTASSIADADHLKLTEDIAMDNQLLTTKEAARYLGVSNAFLERDRWAGARVPFVQVGRRTVRYRQAALDEYIANRTRLSTSEETVRRSQKRERHSRSSRRIPTGL